MRQRIVLWGQNETDEKVLIAASLNAAENKVVTTIFSVEAVTEEFVNSMMKSWRTGHDIPFPMGYIQFEKDLAVTETMIPDQYKVEREDILKRAQTEWNFAVLSYRMFDAFEKEIEDIEEKINHVDTFEPSLWETLKGYWSKVQHQIREKNLLHQHSDLLRSRTNALFDKLKAVRKVQDQVFKKVSDENRTVFQDKLQELEEKVEKGLSLQPIFEQLKKIQRELKTVKMTRDHRDKTWNKLDHLFKVVKEKRYGDRAGSTNSPMQRLERRYDGLIHAVSKMEKSIGRDKKDLKYQDDRVGDSGNQLEAEMRKAKIKMIEERIRSKTHKLEEMIVTRTSLEAKIEKEKIREEKRKEQQKINEEKERIKQQVAEELKNETVKPEDAEKLKVAADAINSSRKGKKAVPVEVNEPVIAEVGPSEAAIMAAASVSTGLISEAGQEEEE